MVSPELAPIDCPVLRELTAKNYGELLMDARASAAEIGVAHDIYDTTLRLLDDLHNFDDETAVECLRDLPFALTTADVLTAFYDNPRVDKAYVWSATLLADIGKKKVGKDLLDQSHSGGIWTAYHEERMKEHAVISAQVARQNGLCEPIARAIEEHHGIRENAPGYGASEILVDFERTTRDCLTVADFFEAAMCRRNSRNAQLFDERLARCYRHIQNVFSDYDHGEALADRVFEQLTQSLRSLALAS